MNFRNKLFRLSCLLLVLFTFIPNLKAITDQEMDHARAVTALWYLRWVNNGSDYLESLDPKSMSELEGKLKQKEKENIKAFKSVSVPSDYSKWDKEKAVTYWSETFFKSKGLDDQGRNARARVKKKLSAMTFSAPSDPSAKPEAAPSPEPVAELPSAAPEPEETAPAETELPSAQEIVNQSNEMDSMVADQTETVPADQDSKKEGSSNWIYIVALLVLVGIVVWLVIFASRTMQNSSKAAAEIPDEDDQPVKPQPMQTEAPASPRKSEIRQPIAAVAEDPDESESILRDRFARRLSAKDTEIHELQRSVRDLRDENLRLADDNSKLKSDLSIARRELDTLKNRRREAEEAVAPPVVERVAEPSVARTRGSVPTHDIYLGRANSKGIFVRADRKPVEGKSVFVLSTSDSYTGTYRILQSASTIDMALENPEYYLSGGCVAADILATSEADGINTVSSGTAIFEDGCWRVLRKAKIAYE